MPEELDFDFRDAEKKHVITIISREDASSSLLDRYADSQLRSIGHAPGPERRPASEQRSFT